MRGGDVLLYGCARLLAAAVLLAAALLLVVAVVEIGLAVWGGLP